MCWLAYPLPPASRTSVPLEGTQGPDGELRAFSYLSHPRDDCNMRPLHYSAKGCRSADKPANRLIMDKAAGIFLKYQRVARSLSIWGKSSPARCCDMGFVPFGEIVRQFPEIGRKAFVIRVVCLWLSLCGLVLHLELVLRTRATSKRPPVFDGLPPWRASHVDLKIKHSNRMWECPLGSNSSNQYGNHLCVHPRKPQPLRAPRGRKSCGSKRRVSRKTGGLPRWRTLTRHKIYLVWLLPAHSGQERARTSLLFSV